MITILVALPASADAVFDSVGSPAPARDTMVDGSLVGDDIVTEKGGASAPVTPLVFLQP